MGMIEEVEATGKVFKISAEDAVALMRLQTYVFENEGAGIDCGAAIELAGVLVAVSDRLRMQGAHDPEAPTELVIDATTSRALKARIHAYSDTNGLVHLEDVAVVKAALARAGDGPANLCGEEVGCLQEAVRGGFLGGSAALAGLNAQLSR